MAAILCTALPDIGAGTASPAIAAIAQAMPEVNVQLIQMIVSIPSVCLIFFPPIYAKLTMHLRKKTLLWIAFLLMLVGSIGPALTENIYVILFFRLILGISNGIIMPITIDLILDFFEGREQQSMLGYAAAVTSIGGILFQMLGGFLGNIHWQYCFLAADLSIPFYIFALVFIPDKPVKRPEPGRSEKGFGQALQAPLLLLGLFMILWELLYFVFLTNSALYLVNSGIADTAQVGVITAMVTVGGMLMSFLYGRLVQVFHEKILPLAYLMTAVGFFVLCLSDNAVMAGIGAFAIGIGYGISAPCQLNFASLLVPKEAASVATSVCYTARGIGGFISPMVMSAICLLMGKEQGLFSFQLAAVALVVLAAFMYGYVKWIKIKI